MLDAIKGGNGYGLNGRSNPDFLIAGNPFDCYTPGMDTQAKKICSTIRTNTIDQSDRIVLNLESMQADKVKSIKDYLLRRTGNTSDLKRLNELIVILPDGAIETWFLRWVEKYGYVFVLFG